MPIAKSIGQSRYMELVCMRGDVLFLSHNEPTYSQHNWLTVEFNWYNAVITLIRELASVAQSVEQLICNQQVVGSSPICGSIESRLNVCFIKTVIYKYIYMVTR